MSDTDDRQWTLALEAYRQTADYIAFTYEVIFKGMLYSFSVLSAVWVVVAWAATRSPSNTDDAGVVNELALTVGDYIGGLLWGIFIVGLLVFLFLSVQRRIIDKQRLEQRELYLLLISLAGIPAKVKEGAERVAERASPNFDTLAEHVPENFALAHKDPYSYIRMTIPAAINAAIGASAILVTGPAVSVFWAAPALFVLQLLGFYPLTKQNQKFRDEWSKASSPGILAGTVSSVD